MGRGRTRGAEQAEKEDRHDVTAAAARRGPGWRRVRSRQAPPPYGTQGD
jgi:hypothetical protein